MDIPSNITSTYLSHTASVPASTNNQSSPLQEHPTIQHDTGSDSIEPLPPRTLPIPDNNQIDLNSSPIPNITPSPRQSTNDQAASNSSLVDETLSKNNNPINTRQDTTHHGPTTSHSPTI